jgi:hypothetical protein
MTIKTITITSSIFSKLIIVKSIFIEYLDLAIPSCKWSICVLMDEIIELSSDIVSSDLRILDSSHIVLLNEFHFAHS